MKITIETDPAIRVGASKPHLRPGLAVVNLLINRILRGVEAGVGSLDLPAVAVHSLVEVDADLAVERVDRTPETVTDCLR